MAKPPNGLAVAVRNSSVPLFLELSDSGESFFKDWDAASGRIVTIKFPRKINLDGIVRTSNGLFIYGAEDGRPGNVAIQTSEANWATARLLVNRYKVRLLLLRDQSVLIYGGRSAATDGKSGETPSMAIERVRFVKGSLFVERLPDLPGPIRSSFAMVSLSDGRVMSLGGTAPPYIGCMPCYAETWLIDPATRRWEAGPPLREARSDTSASVLPDGTVMVAGGWTPVHDWSRGPTRSVELWRAGSQTFEPGEPLPSASAMHHVQWAPGQIGRQLLLGGGNNASIQLFDLGSRQWRVVGEICQGDERGRIVLYPFVLDGQAYAWVHNEHVSGSCAGGSVSDGGIYGRGWSLLRLRMTPADTMRPLRIDALHGLPLYRSRMAIAPPPKNGPALLIGGTIHAGMNAGEYSAAVDAVWPDGRIQSLPALNQARSDARALTLGDGSRLVLGGHFGHRNAREGELSIQAPEWFPGAAPLDSTRWLRLENEAALSGITAIGRSAEQQIVALAGDQTVRKITLRARPGDPAGRPAIESEDLPPLQRARFGSIAIKAFADGRVVVAGGQVQVHKIALLHDAIDRPEAPDEYVGIGESLPSRRHEIYDPANRQWSTSAPSQTAGDNAVVLDDGRVMKIGVKRRTAPRQRDGSEGETQEEGFIELSSPDGNTWTRIGKELAASIYFRDARLFEIDGEVFLSAQSIRSDTGGGVSMLYGFNLTDNSWTPYWEAGKDENWRAHVGRVLVRTLPNGKRVVLPTNQR